MHKIQIHELNHNFKVLKAMYVAHLKNIKVYTQNFLFSLISYPAQVVMFYYLWTAILSTTDLGNVTTNDLLAYYLLAFLIERLTSNRRVTDNLEEDIVTGKMAIYFVRPIPIYANNLAEYLNQLTVNSVIMTPIALLLLVIFTPSVLVLNPLNLLVFALMVFLSGICQFLIYFTIGILAFWLERVWGIRMGFNWITSFLSGRLIPLYLFPPFMNTFSQILPFRFFTFELIMVLLNPVKMDTIIVNFIILCIWLLILLSLAWLLMKKGSQKFVGYGV